MSKVSKFKILPKHILISNMDLPIGNACSNNSEFWRQELSSAKDTINEDQIKSYELLRIACLVITIDCIQSAKFTKHYTWSHRTWQKKYQLWNGYRRSDMIKHFLKVTINKWLLTFLTTFLCSFFMIVIVITKNWIWRHVSSVRLTHRDSRRKRGENGIRQCITLIPCISSFLSQKVSVILITNLHFTIMPAC